MLPSLDYRRLTVLSRPFADAVRAGVGSVMCSYNRINGTYACENPWTTNYLLKNELDFQGFGMHLFPIWLLTPLSFPEANPPYKWKGLVLTPRK